MSDTRAQGAPAVTAPVAVATGGGPGIGLAVTRELLAGGWRVGIPARGAGRYRGLADELGKDAVPGECDVAEEDQQDRGPLARGIRLRRWPFPRLGAPGRTGSPVPAKDGSPGRTGRPQSARSAGPPDLNHPVQPAGQQPFAQIGGTARCPRTLTPVTPGDTTACAESTPSYNARHLTYNVPMTATRVTVSRNGQISVPAAVRHRWRARSVLVIDRGDYAIVRPVPDDPVTALEGAHAGPGMTAEDARAGERAAEQAAGQRRAARSS